MLIDRHARVRGQLLDRLVRRRCGSRSRGPCATARARCRAATRRARAASRPRAGPAGGRRARARRPRTRCACASTASGRSARRCGPPSACDCEPVALQLDRAVEQRVELVARNLLAGEEVAGHQAMVFAALTLEPVPWARLPARPGAARAGATGCCRASGGAASYVQVNRSLLRRVRGQAGVVRLGRRAAAGGAAALAAAARAGGAARPARRR